MSNIGGSEPPEEGSAPQVIKLRKRTKILPQAIEPETEMASEIEPEPEAGTVSEWEPEIIRLRRRVRPPEWDDPDYSYATRAPSPRRGNGARPGQQQYSAARRNVARRSSPVAFYVGAAMMAAAAVGLALVVYFFISKSGPFAVAQASQVPQVPTPTLAVAGGGEDSTVAPTIVRPTERPTTDPNATPVKLFALNPPGPGPNKGQLNLPRGIAQDTNGNFFVVDTENYRVQEFNKAGDFLSAFGSRGSGRGTFKPFSDTSIGAGPGGIAVDTAGNIYVADTWDHRVQKFTKDGKFVSMWGEFIEMADAAEGVAINDYKFYGPRGVAVGPDDSLYVTDTGNKRVLIYDKDGIIVRKIESGVTRAKIDAKYPFDKPGEMNEPIGIAVDAAGNIYVADTRNERIQKFSNDGKPLAQWAVPSGDWAPGSYMEPFLALDGAGNLYATAPSAGAVLKFSPDGKVAGRKTTEGAVTLKTPTGITVTTDGTIYVVDTVANAVVNLGKIP